MKKMFFGMSLAFPLLLPSLVFSEGPAVERLVEQRAVHYLEALRVNDFQTAYQMHSGSLDGSLTAYRFYQMLTSSPLKLIDYEIESVRVNKDEADVRVVRVYDYYQMHHPLRVKRTLNLILVDGQWYLKTMNNAEMMPSLF